MTPSSKSEPELETQPTTTGPDETLDLKSESASEPAAEPASEPAPKDASPVVEAETPAAASEPVANSAPVANSEPVAGTVPLAKDEPPASVPVALFPEAQVKTPEYEDTEDGQADEEADYEEVLGSEKASRYPTLIPLIGSLLGLTAIAALMLVAFALPAIKSKPNQVPIGVSGTAQFQTQVRQALTQDGLTPFKITGYTEERQLRNAILDRKVYGGLSLGTSSITMLVSSGASPIAAQTLNSLASSLAEGGIPVNDLTTLPKSDPKGEGLAAANLPLAIAAILPALILIPLYRRRTAAQVGVTVGAAVLIGLGLSAVLSFALGSTEDSNFLLVSAGLAAGVLATSLLLLGLFAVAGRIGAVVGAVLLILFAAPLSGLSSAPEWLPSPWGRIGQLLPPGANATLLRSDAYFDGNGAIKPLLVLLAWALVGLLLLGLGALLSSRRGEQPVAEGGTLQELLLEEPVTV